MSTWTFSVLPAQAGLGPLPAELDVSKGTAPARRVRSDGAYADTNHVLNEIGGHFGTKDPEALPHLDGASIWEFLPSYMWARVFRRVELAKALIDALGSDRPSKLRIGSVPPADAKAFRSLVAGLASSIGAYFDEPLLPTLSFPLLRTPDRTLRRARQISQYARRMNEGSNVAARSDVLYASMSRWHVRDASSATGDLHLDDLITQLVASGVERLCAILCPYGHDVFGGGPVMMRKKTPGGAVVDWRGFAAWVPGPRLGAGAQLWWRLRRSHAWSDDLRLHGIPMLPVLSDVLLDVLLTTAPEIGWQLRTARELIEQVRPSAVLTIYETGPFQRSLMVAAREKGIPTIGLQHGMIFGNNYDYMHAHVTATPGGRPYEVNIPDTTCVWGPRWREVLLTEGAYPSTAVSVTGSWRYDDRSFDGFGADGLASEHRPAVLVLTAMQGSERLVSAAAAAARRNGLPLLVKPHPSEDAAPLERAVAEAGMTANFLSGQLSNALERPVIVVSQLSASTAEALLHDQPVVLVDFDGQEGWEDYKLDPAMLHVSDPAALDEAVNSLANDAALRRRLAEARKVFVTRLFGDLDGGAARRVAEEIRRAAHPR